MIGIRNVYYGSHMRKPMCEPIKSPDDWRLITWLQNYIMWLEKWNPIKIRVTSKTIIKPGEEELYEKEQLTRNTFLALKHTLTAIRQMVPYIFENIEGVNYVLLGKKLIFTIINIQEFPLATLIRRRCEVKVLIWYCL